LDTSLFTSGSLLQSMLAGLRQKSIANCQEFVVNNWLSPISL
jgi:hypothetical protein